MLHDKGGENEEEAYFHLHTSITFLQYRRACMNNRRRAKSTHPPELPDMELDPEDDDKDHGRKGHHSPEECLAGRGFRAAGEEDEDEEEGEEEEEERHEAEALFHSHDHPFEPPPLTFDMVQGMTRARRLRIWRAVLPRPHNCRNTCKSCCSLFNEHWRLSSIQHLPPSSESLPGRTCRDLDVLDKIPERRLYVAGVSPYFHPVPLP